jgi:hypothetical protein
MDGFVATPKLAYFVRSTQPKVMKCIACSGISSWSLDSSTLRATSRALRNTAACSTKFMNAKCDSPLTRPQRRAAIGSKILDVASRPPHAIGDDRADAHCCRDRYGSPP